MSQSMNTTLRWVRSYPAAIPRRRAYVADELPRLVIDDYDYRPLAELDADVCLLEWDMALSREDREVFEATVRRRPDEITVAPYPLYTVASAPVWAHRLVDTAGRESWVSDRDWFADYFSFGLIYLPRTLVRAFCAAPERERGRSPFLAASHDYADARLTDQTFSIWHRHSYGRRALIEWAVRPVHLHY